MTPEEKLDLILNEAKRPIASTTQFIAWGDIMEKVKESRDDRYFFLFIEKLKYDDKIVGTDCAWQAAFKGMFFEGYDNKAKREAYENDRTRRNEEVLIMLNRRVNCAALAAALLVLISICWDVWKYHHPKSGEGETTIKQTGIFF